MKMTVDEIDKIRKEGESLLNSAVDAKLLEKSQHERVFGQKAESGGLCFTGWKGVFSGLDACFSFSQCHLPNELIEVGDDPHPVGYVSQWIGCLSADKRIYVNLPGLECGSIRLGETFDIGDRRLQFDSPLKNMNELIRQGYVRIITILDELKAA